jgi:hypothetical protein
LAELEKEKKDDGEKESTERAEKFKMRVFLGWIWLHGNLVPEDTLESALLFEGLTPTTH